MTNALGCIDTSSFYGSALNFEDYYDIQIPNVFTPNGDGQNDHFIVEVPGRIYECVDLKIYNRWGQVVFETKDRLVGWNGTYRNKELDPAVFVYRLTYTDWQGTEGELSGNITLIK